jgi:hypothetical protein
MNLHSSHHGKYWPAQLARLAHLVPWPHQPRRALLVPRPRWPRQALPVPWPCWPRQALLSSPVPLTCLAPHLVLLVRVVYLVRLTSLAHLSLVVVDVAHVLNPSTRTLSSSDADLFIVPGSKRFILSAQTPLIRVIIQDAIEGLRALMLFNNAFPSAAHAIEFVRDSLLAVADRYRPAASTIYGRLDKDEAYLSTMVRLVSELHYYFLFNMLLMLFVATSSNSIDPSRGQGAL